MTSSVVHLKEVVETKCRPSMPANTKERVHFYSDRKDCPVCPEFLAASVCVCWCVYVCGGDGVTWSPASGEVVPFGGLPLISREGGKDKVSSHCCCWKPCCKQGSIMHINDHNKYLFVVIKLI